MVKYALFALVAQLDRAPGCGPGGRASESRRAHIYAEDTGVEPVSPIRTLVFETNALPSCPSSVLYILLYFTKGKAQDIIH